MISKDTHPPQKSGILLITGCPRSGTTFVSEFYKQKDGIDLGHETAGEHGTVEWRHAYTDAPKFDVTLSLVRHPLRTIPSLTDLLISLWTHQPSHHVTRQWIARLAVHGRFDSLLESQMWAEAAMTWWVSVYERHQNLYPVLRVEDLKGMEPTKPHAKPYALNLDMDWLWEAVSPLAQNLGYKRNDVE